MCVVTHVGQPRAELRGIDRNPTRMIISAVSCSVPTERPLAELIDNGSVPRVAMVWERL